MSLPTEITFLVSTKEQGGPRNLRFASKINRHVASYSHNKRRTRADDEHRSLSRSSMTLGDRRNTWPVDKIRKADVASPSISEVAPTPAKQTVDDKAQSDGESERKQRRKSADASLYLGQKVTGSKTSRNATGHFNPPTTTQNMPRSMEPLLDHFIRLPDGATDLEKKFIYFYLTEGRQIHLGTSQTPVYCPILDIGQRLMVECSVCPLTYSLHGEALLSRITGQKCRPDFYKRRAQSYHRLNDIISDEATTLCQKVCATIMLAFADHSLGNPELSVVHTRAVNGFIETSGGLTNFLDQVAKDSRIDMPTRFYVLPFVRAQISVESWPDLSSILGRFLDTLQEIQLWADKLTQTFETMLDGPLTSSTEISKEFSQISWFKTILHGIIEKYLCGQIDGQSDPLAPTAFLLCYNVCMSLVELGTGIANYRAFLQTLAQCIAQSSIVGTNPCLPCPEFVGTVYNIVGYVRGTMIGNHGDQETRICQATIDASKIIPLLSPTSLTRLAQRLLQCSLCLVEGSPAEKLDESYLYNLRLETENAWLIHGTDALQISQ
ncbi:hypothetical protein LTR10_023033 [Elasticomyces elasticus]|uniref:Uncharacterized protein n=1 Tax=Exophiala sideris TaxID=1016849 RepID=A0ABR0J6K8_9EURO|nr:hypothetical protein LTR10_023033 [Elasticomyces elasticus]KAK5028935.1 hypothetical protein LTS07_006316 [Exophiala sideris]KAK5035804.1 hypothetical protein LTR13_005935 [Exophiala sideris]KAK5057439.1 hypothetical protein LTR69_007480 [Exophiala sideris]KAK5181586.1 hypothetical protein LTR44_005785 [Eurotiomycetes sp. CCFEE 6388]